MGIRREQFVLRIATASAAALFAVGTTVLAVTSPDNGDATVLSAGQSAGGDSSSSDSHRPEDQGGGWEEHRSTSTSPDNSRPEIPPGHNKPTTTTTTKPTSITVPSTTTPTTTAPPSPCAPPAGTSATGPSDLVPQFSVLDVFPAPAYVGPLDPAHPNQRPWDEAIVTHGATEGYARTWTATSGPGGYTVYAFEFPSASSAQAAGADAFASFVEDYGAAPFQFCDGVSSALIVGDAARAYWTQGRFLRIVDVSTQSPRDVVPAQAQADMRWIVEALLAL